MKILLAYATYSNGTDLASQIVEKVLTEHNHQVNRKLIKETKPEELSSYDLLIFGSPSWWNRNKDGQPHEFFLNFIDAMDGETLSLKRFAIFGLGDEKYTHFCGAVDVLEAFVKRLQGTLITDSLRVDGFYFDPKNNEKKIKEWTEHLIAKLIH